MDMLLLADSDVGTADYTTQQMDVVSTTLGAASMLLSTTSHLGTRPKVSFQVLQQQLASAKSTATREHERHELLLEEKSNLLNVAEDHITLLKNVMISKEIKMKEEIKKFQNEIIFIHEKYDQYLCDVFNNQKGSVQRMLGMEKEELIRHRTVSNDKSIEILALKLHIRTCERMKLVHCKLFFFSFDLIPSRDPFLIDFFFFSFLFFYR